MSIPEELAKLLQDHPGDMERKMVEAYCHERSVEAIVEVAKGLLREGTIYDTPKA